MWKTKKHVTFTEKKVKIKVLIIKKNHEVRDHCHYTGKCGGAAHSI